MICNAFERFDGELDGAVGAAASRIYEIEAFQGFIQINGGTRNQQLPAASCILHMNALNAFFRLYIRNETVGAIYK